MTLPRPSARRALPWFCNLLSLLGLFLATTTLAQNGVRHIHQERSLYRNIIVTEDSQRRCMRFTITDRRGQNQSCRYLDNHDRLVFPYAKMVLTSLLVHDAPSRILIVGLGGGTLVHTYHALFPEAEIDIVEIDTAVIDVAERFFDFRESEHIQVEAVDARVFIKRAGLRGEQYDLVILDAFNGEYIPEHLMTQEFLEETKALLPADGMVVANTFSTSRLYDAESATYSAVFGQFYNVRMFGTGNRIIIATLQPLPTPEQLEQRAPAFKERLARFGFDITEMTQHMTLEPDWDTDARLLTDQYAPANLLNN